MKRAVLLLCVCVLLFAACARPDDGTMTAPPTTEAPAPRTAPGPDDTDYEALSEACFSEVPEAAETDFTYTLATDGTAKITAYLGAGGKVRVPGTLGGATVASVADGVFAGRDDLRTLILPDTVTDFGKGILEGTELEAFRSPFPNGETAFLGYFWGAESNLDNALPVLRALQFLEIRAAGAFDLPDGALRDCSGLLAVRLPAGTAAGADAFAECTSLRWVNAQALCAVGERAFSGCKSLQSLAFGSALTRIGFAALRDCSGLLELSLPFIGSAPGENAFLGYLFGARTPALASGFYPPFLRILTLSEGATTLPDLALYECRSLREIALPASLTAVGACALRGCVSLESLTLPEGCAAVGENACAGCSALATVRIPAGATVGVNAFLGTPYAEENGR